MVSGKIQLAGLFLIILLSVVDCTQGDILIHRHHRSLKGAKICYGVVFDASSSATKALVYTSNCISSFSVPDVELSTEVSQRVKPGIATLSGKIGEIEAYLEPLIKFITSQVSAADTPTTPVLVGGTAGLRALNQADQDAIMDQFLRILTTKTKFLCKGRDWVQVITGEQEGALLWLSINYMLGTIKREDKSQFKTYPTVDLGGASTQIAFVPKELDQEGQTVKFDWESSLTAVDIEGFKKYQVFSPSYQGFGNDQMRGKIVQNHSIVEGTIRENPCYFKGWTGKEGKYDVKGTGQWEDCMTAIKKILDSQQCVAAGFTNCGIEKSVFVAPPKDITLYAVSGVYYAAVAIKVGEEFTLKQFEEQLSAYCNRDWETVKQDEKDEGFLHTSYFLNTYAFVLLKTAYQLGDTQIIRAPKSVGNVAPGWTLGYLMMKVENSDSQILNNIVVIASILAVIFFI